MQHFWLIDWLSSLHQAIFWPSFVR
jgi:hypothetical protein